MEKVRVKAYLSLLTTAVLWGAAVPLIKKSFETTTPLLFLTYRFIIVIILTTVPFLFYQKNQPKIKNPLKLLFIGFLSFPANLLLLFYGLEKTSAMEAALLAALSPILFNLGGWFFLHENITKKERLGLSIAMLGTLLIVLKPLLSRQGLDYQNHLWGNILVLIGNIIGVVGLIWAKKEKKNYTHFQVSYFSFLSAVISFTLLALLFEPAFTQDFLGILRQPALWGILYMATFGSIIAYSAMIYGQSLIEVSEASLFTYLQPLFAMPLAIFWLKESLSPVFLFGSLLILLGVFLSEDKRRI